MFEVLFLSLMLGLGYPTESTGVTIYPSGLDDADKYYFNFPPPASKNPNVILSRQAFDKNENIISSGIYAVMPSFETNELLLLQSGEIKAKLTISKIVSLTQKISIPTAEVRNLSSNHLVIIYRNEDREIYSTLSAP